VIEVGQVAESGIKRDLEDIVLTGSQAQRGLSQTLAAYILVRRDAGDQPEDAEEMKLAHLRVGRQMR